MYKMKKIPNANYDYYDVPKLRNLKELVELRKDSAAVAYMYREDGKVVRKTFHEMYEDVKQLAGYFYANYKHETHIAVMGENSYAWLICALAIAISGNVAVAIDKDADEETLKRQLKLADVKAVYYTASYCEKVPEVFRNSFPLEDWEQYAQAGRKTANKNQQDPEADAMIFFTSGTTGFSKAVVLSQKNIVADMYGAMSIFSPNGRVVDFLPFHHAFGFVTATLMPYGYGVTTMISSSFKHLMDDFKLTQPHTVFAVPMVVETLYRQIWRTARREKRDGILKFGIRISNGASKIGLDVRGKLFKSLQKEFGGKLEYIICGGARLEPQYVKWFRSIGVEVLNGYGITECSPVVAVNRPHFKRDGSVGQICRGVRVDTVEEEIVVSGDIVMKGYYKDRKATEEVLKNGRFYTGDLGYVDDDGFLWITGRKKDLIILSNGENVSPDEIEGVLKRDKGVAETVVYESNNRIIASIYPNEGYMGDQDYFDELIYEYNKDKPKNRQIALVKLRTKEFPRNNNTKILRKKVIEEDESEE